jgi:succinate dehydrogenase flavin-adding protein (antitoxin of CptAB toxin-antitoxin module)
MLLKFYHHLYQVVDCDVESTYHRSYENNDLDIFEMITNTSEPLIKLVNR